MSSNSISIKPNNHRILQCPTAQKTALINKLIEESKYKDIVVVSSVDVTTLREAIDNKKVRVVEDKELVKDKEFTCEFLISYDMPIKAIVYMARVGKAREKAVMLLDESEQNDLHSIETILGRAIKQETTEGFEYKVIAKVEDDRPKRKKLTKDEITEIARQRHEDATVEKPKKEFKKPREGDGKWEKKKKAPNKFLGKDENGKAIFSGKSGDRNHRHDGSKKETFNTPKKVGKTISIKARKPKEEES